jgi:hypothetical protein
MIPKSPHAEKKIQISIGELKSMLCTKHDIETLAMGDIGSCLSWLNEPYCWFEDCIDTHRRIYRKMALQMNFMRRIDGKKPIIKKSD